MAQFDVYRVRGGELVVDCQSNLLSALPTRFVAPLRHTDAQPIDRLNPTFRINGRDYAMITQLAGAIDRLAIVEIIASVSEREFDVKGALDLLIVGF
jgi:toxin CcdB